MTLFIDNYDSFSYILLDYLHQLGLETTVYRNDQIDWDYLRENSPSMVVMSPGPGTPHSSGELMRVVETYHESTPMLGICLGHQALGVFFGAKLNRSVEPVHGIPYPVFHREHSLFAGLSNPFTAMRYHSLELAGPLPFPLEPICHTSDGIIMGLAHKSLPLVGLQFHPESIGTEEGFKLLTNWKRSTELLLRS